MSEKHIVILTGAGISAESGIATFRASDGLWEKHRIEDVATPEGFARNPQLVHQFYNARRARLHDKDVQPNAAHFALAQLQQSLPAQITLITQNVDDLHERAGSDEVLHMHGSLLNIRCLYCNSVHHDWHEDCDIDTCCPHCKKTAGLRPDIVWFGEMPYHMATIEKSIANCTHFVAIGTSGQVYPAAGFANLARQYGAEISEINLEPSSNSRQFRHSYIGKATVEVPRWVKIMLD
ncbi:MAG: NAD-dependent deacylase [Cardiobacteriaceae bacterium]|nr:NAD-dependent deacylase [Cardiobacteriaceae bacterium]